MENISILRKISLIHAVKCNKTTSTATAIGSFNTLIDLKVLIENSQSNDLEVLNEKVIEWQNQKPEVSNYEISSLLSYKRNG